MLRVWHVRICIVSPSIFIAATSVGAVSNTFGFQLVHFLKIKLFLMQDTSPSSKVISHIQNISNGSIIDTCDTDLFLKERFAQLKTVVLRSPHCFLFQ